MKLQINFKKSAWISLAALLFAIINGYFLFPTILKFMLKRNLQLRPGSQMRPLFEKIPFPLTFKVYLFNVTNPEDVIEGGKPILDEIGPYIFDEWKEREDIVDDNYSDTVTYTLKNRFVWRPDLSKGLTGDEMVTLPHLIIFGTLMAVKRDRAPMLPMVVKAIKSIFDNPSTPFMKVKAMDFLFNGFAFKCDGADFAAKAVCAGIRSEAREVRIINETFLSISLLGHKNNTSIGRFKVFRGIKDINHLGRIVSVDNDRSLSVWDGDECNRFQGTDSTIFPPFLKQETGLWTFTPDICMSLNAHFVRKSSYAGLPTSIYSIDFGDFKNDPRKHCYCHEAPEVCPPRGTLDLMPCLNIPIFGSKPHFLDADEELLTKVEGLRPNRSLHDVFVNFESISGTPLEGYKRLQFSLQLEPLEEFDLMSRMPEMLFPLVWVEESVKLNKTYTNLLKYQLFLAKKFNSTTKWIGIVGGAVGLIFSAVMIYNENKRKTPITVAPNSRVKPALDLKTLDNIKYLSDKVAEVTKSNDEIPAQITVE